ncbi:MAG: hypothetical protein ACXVFT_22705 [Solirubrobacteraceae bacterium]
MTAEAEPWLEDALWLDDEEAVVPLELEESSSPEVTLAVVAVSDWPEVVCVESLAAVLPSEPVAAIVPKAITKVDSAAATTRRRMSEIRRARARRRSRTRSAFGVGGGVEGMPAT